MRGCIAALAAKYGAAVLAITYLRKSAGAAIYRPMGSLAFAAAARAVFGIVADPDDKTRRLFVAVKLNLAPDGGGLAYRIEAPDGIPRVAWESGPVAVDVNAVMGGFESSEEHGERREAAEWLRDFLAHGPQPVPEIQRQCKQAGLAWITCRRAADALGVFKRKSSFKTGWEWSLSEGAHREGAHTIHTDVSIFEGVAENKGDNTQGQHEGAHLLNGEHVRRDAAPVLPLAGDAVEV